MSKSLLVYLTLMMTELASGSDFADGFASCVQNSNSLNPCLHQTLEELRPLMSTGLPALGLPPTEPMNIQQMQFAQGAPPVLVQASFSNVTVRGLSTFITDYIEVDPVTRTFRIGLTVPQMDVSGLYEVAGEVFILPLEGGGSFTSSMAALSATGRSKVLEDEERRLKVDNFDIDFTIGQVFIKMNNLFNGENQLLADTVNKFLNDHSQEVIKEVKPEISRHLSELVTRVINDAFSSIKADELLDSLNTNQRLLDSLNSPSAGAHRLPPPSPPSPVSLIHASLPPLHRALLGPQQRLGQITKARLLRLFGGKK